MASQFLAAVEQVLTCPVCYQLYMYPHIPKDLNCPHTCCQVCLENMVVLSPKQPLKCPMRCEKKTVIPPGGVTKLRTNLHLKNLAEEYPGYVNTRQPEVLRCDRHDEKMHLYCEPCNKMACQNCFIVDHQGSDHVILDVKEVSIRRKGELHDVLAETKEKEKRLEETIGDLESLLKNITTSVKSEKLIVDKCVETTIENVQKEGEILKAELDIVAGLKLESVRKDIAELRKRTQGLKHACNLVQQSWESPEHAYITQHASLMQHIRNMTTALVTKPSSPVCKYQHTGKFIEQNEIDINLGRIVQIRQLKLEEEFGEFRIAYGISCSTDCTLAVADFDGKVIAVYQESPDGQYVHEFDLKLNPTNQWSPRQVISHLDGDFLVARGNGIEMYSSTGHYEHTISTTAIEEESSTKPVAEMWSVTPFTAGGFLTGDVKRCQIAVHDETGDVVKTLKTNIKPKHLTIVGNNHVAMSDNTQGKVSVIDVSTGEVTLDIGIQKAEGIYYDEDTDCFLVARSEPGKHAHTVIANTGIVEQYCGITGKLVACVAQGLFAPRGIVRLSDGRLAVADTKTVKIFKVT